MRGGASLKGKGGRVGFRKISFFNGKEGRGDFRRIDRVIRKRVSIRSTPYCISQNNVVTLHGGIIFLILRPEYEV